MCILPITWNNVIRGNSSIMIEQERLLGGSNMYILEYCFYSEKNHKIKTVAKKIVKELTKAYDL